MDLNKLTKKEIIDYADSQGISVNIKDTKEFLISKIKALDNRKKVANKSSCAGCGIKFSNETSSLGVWLWPDSNTTLETRVYDESILFCGICHRDWGYPETGEKVELNPKTGKLRYVSINSDEKYYRIKKASNKLDNTDNKLSTKIVGMLLVIFLILVIAQFI